MYLVVFEEFVACFQFCFLVNGARVTSCKSAKDRTSMDVTLEQARILLDYHQLAEHTFSDVLSEMRR